MPTIEHSALGTGELHEPKGAASASANQVYISDGAGSGDWTYFPSGWGYYKDNASEQTFTSTPAKLSIDGAGTTTETDYLPPEIRGSGNLWNTTTDKITPITLGDAYEVRLNLPITAKATNPNTLTVALDIGGGASPSNVVLSLDLSVLKTPTFSLVTSFPIFCLSTFITNGGQLFLSTDTGTVGITAPAITVVRLHSGGI